MDGCLEPGLVVHQTALYDMLWSFVIFGIILWLVARPRARGFLFLSWAGLYAVGRIVTDFLRVDKTWFGLGLTGSQLTSIAAVLVVLVLLARYRGVPDTAPAIPDAAAARTSEEEGPPAAPEEPSERADHPQASYPKPPPPPTIEQPDEPRPEGREDG